jgi:hypothetical protein
VEAEPVWGQTPADRTPYSVYPARSAQPGWSGVGDMAYQNVQYGPQNLLPGSSYRNVESQEMGTCALEDVLPQDIAGPSISEDSLAEDHSITSGSDVSEGRLFPCPGNPPCDQAFTRHSDARRHLERGSCSRNRRSQGHEFHCEQCRNLYSRQDALLRHMQRKHVCATSFWSRFLSLHFISLQRRR